MSGLGLLLATALAWYRFPGGPSLTAWQAFAVTDIVLALAGATALITGAVSLAKPWAAFPVAASAITTSMGCIAGALALVRIVSPPDDLSPQLGAWLGLLACIGIAIGGYYGMKEERA